jgi:hypothetical protein
MIFNALTRRMGSEESVNPSSFHFTGKIIMREHIPQLLLLGLGEVMARKRKSLRIQSDFCKIIEFLWGKSCFFTV